MDTREAIRRTRDLLAAHNLSHLDVSIMRTTVRLAECRFRRSVPWEKPAAYAIRLSGPVVKANDWEALAPVVLHEIAHAIAGWEAQHGPAFVQVAIALGGVPSHSHTLPNLPAGGWRAKCERCGQEMRKPRLHQYRRFHCRCTREMDPATRPFLTWKHADGRQGTCLDSVREIGVG